MSIQSAVQVGRAYGLSRNMPQSIVSEGKGGRNAVGYRNNVIMPLM